MTIPFPELQCTHEYDCLSKWLYAAAELAKLEKQTDALWHNIPGGADQTNPRYYILSRQILQALSLFIQNFFKFV